ncbi:L-asparaginase [Rhodoferax ferrireducens]|uniref:L-asparaginase n=1 Tax=Rhodoferax ferrireducens TaxID=192843 RepID=A0ABU2C9G4_9BURK|nr:asparaginase [Rhodoferax ferrireducens]MDR7377979.1 L-asparaginase [Rhodoferax ferrireducens]
MAVNSGALDTKPSSIVVLGTGGTIAGRASSAGDNIGYTAGEVGVAQLLESIGGFQDGAFRLLAEQVAQVDSKDMGFALWQQLAARCAYWLAQPEVAAIVITHGTDTLEETAYFLQAVLDPARPIVLACAMRPATALVPDGPQNLLDAMAVASTPGARGVLAVCAGNIHGAQDVQKVHSYKVDAFSSGEAGLFGVVEEGRVRLFRPWPSAIDFYTENRPPAQVEITREAIKNIVISAAAASDWPRVEIVLNYAGANGLLVDALVAQGVRGIVVAGTGNGTLHLDLQAALLRAMAAGVRVLRSTRCVFGRVQAMPADAIPDAQGLSPVKARIALLLELLAAP